MVEQYVTDNIDGNYRITSTETSLLIFKFDIQQQ